MFVYVKYCNLILNQFPLFDWAEIMQACQVSMKQIDGVYAILINFRTKYIFYKSLSEHK